MEKNFDILVGHNSGPKSEDTHSTIRNWHRTTAKRARNRLSLLVTDVSKVSIGKADSWVGLLTIRTSKEEDRSILRCDSPKVRLDVTPRSEITNLKDERTIVAEATWAGVGWCIPRFVLPIAKSDVRSASNRHVYKSAVHRRIFVGDIVIHRSPLLFIYAT